jgi:excisionase family DNA binding protein
VSETRAALLRGVLVERVVVSTALDPFLNLKALSGYTGLSVKTLRRAINDEPSRSLPAYRIGAAIVVRRSEVDAWMAARRTVGRPSLVAAMRDLGSRQNDALTP